MCISIPVDFEFVFILQSVNMNVEGDLKEYTKLKLIQIHPKGCKIKSSYD